MKLTTQIAKAINRLINERKMSAAEIAIAVGASEVTVNRWRKLKVEDIQEDNWLKLEPLIAPYMEGMPNKTDSIVSNEREENIKRAIAEQGLSELLSKAVDIKVEDLQKNEVLTNAINRAIEKKANQLFDDILNLKKVLG